MGFRDFLSRLGEKRAKKRKAKNMYLVTDDRDYSVSDPVIKGTLRHALDNTTGDIGLLVEKVNLSRQWIGDLSNRTISGQLKTRTRLLGQNFLFSATNGPVRWQNIFHRGAVNSRFRFTLGAMILSDCTFMSGDDEALDIAPTANAVLAERCQFFGPQHGILAGQAATTDPTLLEIKLLSCLFKGSEIRTPTVANATVHIENCDIHVIRSGTELNEARANIINNRYYGDPSFDERPIRIGKINFVTGLPYLLRDDSLYLEGNTWDQSYSSQNDLVRHEGGYGVIPSSMYRTTPIALTHKIFGERNSPSLS